MDLFRLSSWCILWAALMLFPLPSRGGDFVDLPAGDYPVDSVLPYYTVVIPLGSDVVPAGSGLRIDYPEYEPLTSAEERQLRAWGITLPDTLEVTTRVGMVKKKRQLEVALSPFVMKDGRASRLTSFKLAVETTALPLRATRQTTASDRWATSSVLSSGKWVKIRVADEGIYQLTTAQLSSMGFSDPSRVRLYGYGGLIQPETFDFDADDCPPDDLEEVPLYRLDDALLFFAEGTIRWTLGSGSVWSHTNNIYSLYSYYFLTESDDDPMEMPELDSLTPLSTVTEEVTAHALVDDDAYSWFRGGRRFYSSVNFTSTNPQTVTLSTPGIVEGGEATVEVNFAAASSSSRTYLSVEANGESLGSLSAATLGSYQLATVGSGTFTTTALTEENQIRLTATAGNSARLDYVRVSYPRTLSVESTPLVFTTASSGTATFRIANATATTRLWRIGRAGDPTAEVPTELSGTSLTATVDDASRRYVVFDASASYPSPTYVGEVANQNLHADSGIDMVIIVPASGDLTSEAERLAEAHRTVQGLSVKVVSADQIYNEFSSGTPDATAYRRYLKMLYDRADEATLPRFLLFFGDCLWDNRMVTTDTRSFDPDDYLLSFESDNSVHEINCYVTDDYFGMLDDGEGENILSERMDIAVGRFPCHEASDAAAVVDKTIRYMQNDAVGSWKNLLCFMADDGDSNLHMEGANAVIEEIADLTRNFVIKPVYWDAYSREVTTTGVSYPQVEEELANLMSSGALVMNYTGHGDPDQLSVEEPLTIEDFQTASSDNLPLWVMASCEITPYDDFEDNIGRSGLLNASGGGIAFVCASRTVYSDRNETFNEAFMTYLMTQTDGERNTFGEALMQAKNQLVEMATDRTVNRIKYSLTGDPALVLRAPTLEAVIDSISGISLADTTDDLQLSAGSTVVFTGRVLDSAGQTNESFNGIVTASVYDREETVTCLNNAGGSDVTPYTYTDRTKILYEGSDSVRSGRFSFTMRVPVDISYSTDCGRVVLYAVNDDHSEEANGSNERFYFDGTSDELTGDSLGPDVYIYLNRVDFVDGGHVGPTPVFYAVISDSSGVNTTGNGVGHDLELTIDGPTSLSYVLNSYFSYDLGSATQGTVTYQLPELEDGNYSLQFRAWDILNQPTTRTLSFVVESDLAAQLSVCATSNPARTSTTFVLTYDSPGAEGTFSVEVYDVSGRLLWVGSTTTAMASGGISIPWNLGSAGGGPINGGLYLYRARAEVDGYHTVTKAQKLIILK